MAISQIENLGISLDANELLNIEKIVDDGISSTKILNFKNTKTYYIQKNFYHSLQKPNLSVLMSSKVLLVGAGQLGSSTIYKVFKMQD